MTIKQSAIYSFAFLLGLCLVVLPPTISLAQESGLGYSEAPFSLIENPNTAFGETPLAAVQAASDDERPITEELAVEEENYTFLILNFNYIGVSAVTKRTDDQWQFICRAGGLMQPEELSNRCQVPSEISQSLYNRTLEALSENARR